jgi:hypothetical protein
MPVIKVYGIPASAAEHLPRLTTSIQHMVASVHQLGVKKEQVTVFYPANLMQEGLGEELVAEFVGTFKKRERTRKLLDFVAKQVRMELTLFANQHVPHCTFAEVIIPVFDRERGGYNSLERDPAAY